MKTAVSSTSHRRSSRVIEKHHDQKNSEALWPQPKSRGLSWQVGLSYPSPPMSRPPSPYQHQSNRPNKEGSSLEEASMLLTTRQSTTFLPATHQGLRQTHAVQSSNPSVSHSSPTKTQPQAQSEPSLEEFPPFTQDIVDPHSRPSPPESESNSGAQGASASASHGGRRSKAHVANACGNCKRAHLSCDVQRPCSRCIATGKQDSCRDVPQKKRGRPRLREDTELQKDTSASSEIPQGQEVSGVSLTGERPFAPLTHRRGDSLRTLRSSISSTSALSTSSPTSYGRPVSRSINEPSYGVPLHAMVTPTAFLDLDLIIIKANAAFQQLFMGLKDIRGRRLAEIARPTEGDSFQTMRNQLRGERESREPHYLPPIIQAGHDPLSGTTERDLDEVSRGFDDRQYWWTYTFSGGLEQALLTRVRLAKSSSYFVTVTLPPLPMAQTYAVGGQAPPSETLPSPVSTAGSLQAMPPPFDPTFTQRGSIVQTATPFPLYSYHGMYSSPQSSTAGRPTSSSQNYTFHSSQTPFLQQQQQQPYSVFRSPPTLFQMQSLAEPPAIAGPSDPFGPRFAPRRHSQPQPQLQPQGQPPMAVEPLGPPSLPSLSSVTAPVPAVPTQQRTSPRQQSARRHHRSSSSESGGPGANLRSPTKKRRTGMEIGDVLQK